MRLPASLWRELNQRAKNHRWPPKEEDAIERFVAQARAERLIHLAHTSDLPGPLRAAIAAQRGELIMARAGVARMHAALEQFLDHVEPVPVVVLKGIAYGLYLYDEPVQRPAKDVDVLVPIESYEAINQKLSMLGFSRAYGFGRVGLHPDYPESNFLIGPVLIEVHHSFIQRSRHTVPYDRILARSRPLGERTLRLDDTDALLAHCLGFAKEHFNVTLSHWLDLWLLLDQPGVRSRNFDDLVQEAADWSVLTAFLSCLRTIPQIFPEAAPHPLVRGAQSHPRKGIRPNTVLDAPHLGRLGQILVKFRALDGWRRRVAFVAQLLKIHLATFWRPLPKRPGD